MSMTTSDILRFTARQEYLGQVLENVFFYEVVNVPNDPTFLNPYDAILASFETRWGVQVRTIQGTQLAHRNYRVDNLSNGFDFRELNINLFGGAGGQPMPSYVALAVRLHRGSNITRDGQKRIAGLTEVEVDGNLHQLNATNVAQIEDAHKGTLVSQTGNVPYAVPVIIGRINTGTPTAPHYVLDLTKRNPVVDASIKATVSTQNSRKPGRGI